MSQVFSTDLVPASDRLDAWRHNARQICGDCRFQFPKAHPFHGSIERRRIAGLELTRFSSSPVSFAKFPTVSLHSDDRSCIVITQLEGVRRYCQEGTVAILKPGDSTMVDSGRPWSSDCPSHCARLYLRVPRWFMENRLRMSSLPVLPRIPGATGLGATLFRFVTSLYEQAAMLTLEEGAAAVEAYLDILSGCIGQPYSTSEILDRPSDLFSRIERFVETHLPEPTLSPAEVACAVGISTRHLHRLFSRKPSTLSQWIRERRLQECHADLSDPRLRERTITEIAFYWGFSDSAHFSRSFKKQFGVSPRRFRSRVWSDSWTEVSGRVSSLLLATHGRHSQPN